ncbi:MAG: polysaccharide biosynthesis/export family protein [Candidatus Omnitrophota bacterium]
MKRKITLILCLFIFCQSSLLFAQENKEEAKASYLKGNDYFNQRRYREAEEQYIAALKLLMQKPKESPVQQQEPPTSREPLKAKAGGEYIIDQEDVLLVSAWQSPSSEAEGEFTIQNDDTLLISVWQNPDLDQETKVRPDGKISFPLVGDVVVKDMTIPQLRDSLTEKLKEFIRYPDVSVTIKELGGAKELSQEVTVRPDGKISFPLAGDIEAKGLTIEQLRHNLKESLKTQMRYPDVSVIIKKLGGAKVIVLGEVGSPGVYSVSGARTILEAIGLAGGFTKDSVPSSTVLIREPFAEKPKAQRLNLSSALKGDLSANVTLLSEDVVFVPKKFIANLNYFLNQILEPLSKGAYAAREFQGW